MKAVQISLFVVLVCSALSIMDRAQAEPSFSNGAFKGKIAVSAKDAKPHWEYEPLKAPAGAPNILLIILDDVGFGDASTFGGAVQTPSLDRLAANGLRYNQFHTAGLCSPTRAALLSGRNHHHVGFGGFGGVGFPGYHGVWQGSTASIAEVLREHGYSTAAFGKWHNTPLWEVTPAGPFDRWPTGLGFDYYYGNVMGVSSQWEPTLWRNTVRVQQPATREQGYHYTRDITDEAIGWIHTHQAVAPDKPYFVYFATGAAHAPHHVGKEWIQKYKGRFDMGWDRLREKTFLRQKQLGIVPTNTDLAPRPAELAAWNSLSSDEKKLFARQMEIYAGFLSQTDHEVGRLIQAAQEGPQGSNTLILYVVGDNGGAAFGLAGFDGVSNSVQDQLSHLDDLGGRQYNNMYAAAWGWASSTPFQWFKGIASHLGAIRNPLVASWPARIKDKGGLRTQFTHVADVAPTLYEAAGIAPPEQVKGIRQEPLDGFSFVSTFEKSIASKKPRTQYFEIQGNRAIYHDGWLASAFHGLDWLGNGEHDPVLDRWQLYHVAEDFSQAHDVAGQYPAKLEEMKTLFDQEARKNNVYPLGMPEAGFRKPAWHAGRREFTYRGGFPGLPLFSPAVPHFVDMPHRIEADMEITEKGEEGVILAAGGRLGGFSLYVKGGKLVYEIKVPGGKPETIISRESLPVGKIRLAAELDSFVNEKGAIDGRLYINGRQVGEGHFSEPPRPDWFDNFDIGQDSASPVSNAYEPPFRFSGALDRVRIMLR